MKIKERSKVGFRTVILLKNGNIVSKNTEKRSEADDFVLNSGDIKLAKIRDNKTGDIEVVRF
jgi:hypothetical protein